MNRFELGPAYLRALVGVFSIALFNGGSCVVSYCSEDCNPCVTTCQCHTCHQNVAADWDSSHRMRVFRLHEEATSELAGRTERHQTFAWIGGLTLERALGRTSFDDADLRQFSEGVIGVNRELLDLAPETGSWTFARIEHFEVGALVHFDELDPAGARAAGSLEFLFDPHGGLSEIDRILVR